MRLRSGNVQLAAGIGKLSGGGGQLTGGLTQLRDGAGTLETGLGELTSGTGQLESGLAGGVSPTGALVNGLGVMQRSVAKFRGQLPSPKQLEELKVSRPGSSTPAISCSRRSPARRPQQATRQGSP